MELLVGTEDIAEYEAANRITVPISTAVVKFSAIISAWNADLGKVASTSNLARSVSRCQSVLRNLIDLDIFRRLNPMNAGQRSCWEHPGSMVAVSTISNGFTFNIADRVITGGSP